MYGISIGTMPLLKQAIGTGRPRFVAYGYMGNRMYEDRMYVVVFTWRGGTKRIISFRPASQKEVNEYG